jgi:hypothetical protein
MQCETVSGGPHGNQLIAEVFRKMQKQGYRTFYRGLNLGLIGMFPYSAIDLGTFGKQIRTYLLFKRKFRISEHGLLLQSTS